MVTRRLKGVCLPQLVSTVAEVSEPTPSLTTVSVSLCPIQSLLFFVVVGPRTKHSASPNDMQTIQN